MKLTSQLFSLTCLTPTFWPVKALLRLGRVSLNRGRRLSHAVGSEIAAPR